jgi:hypothetical protein
MGGKNGIVSYNMLYLNHLPIASPSHPHWFHLRLRKLLQPCFAAGAAPQEFPARFAAIYWLLYGYYMINDG